jgi:hypothetical protein
MSDEFGSAAEGAFEHLAADSVAGLAGAKPGPGGETCLNCGAVLAGDFCQDCGQSAGSLRKPFWSLLGESLETFFSLDGRIAHTLPDLMLHPGRITRAYLDGQRTRFIPPFRLYVFASLVFFVLLPLVTGQGINIRTDGGRTIAEARAEIEQAYADGETTEEEYLKQVHALDAVEAAWKGGIPGLVPDTSATPGDETGEAAPQEEWAGFVPQEAIDAMREAGERGNPEAASFAEVMEDPMRLAAKTQEWIPRMMFVLLPVYACLLGVVYLWRRQFLFFDHLIVSLHFHAALFLAMSAGFLVSMLIGMGWVILALLVYSNWYLYRLNRTVYGRGKFASIVRTALLDSVYFGIILSALLGAAILGALSL